MGAAVHPHGEGSLSPEHRHFHGNGSATHGGIRPGVGTVRRNHGWWGHQIDHSFTGVGERLGFSGTTHDPYIARPGHRLGYVWGIQERFHPVYVWFKPE